jgi:hypothetical protein
MKDSDIPFIPLGGYPPLYRKDDKKASEKTLESRGFVSTNIVSISNIMSSKKKEDLFNAFGSEDEDGIDPTMVGLYETPHEFEDIKNEKINLNELVKSKKSGLDASKPKKSKTKTSKSKTSKSKTSKTKTSKTKTSKSK